MRLLIVTQAVDTEDPVLGFFVRWIEEFSKHFEHVEVICLKEGKYAVPSNVRVHSLGKEKGKRSRLVYVARFLKLVWQRKQEYDAVFVHMNQEYVLVAGWLWKCLRKPVYMWRNHYAGSWLTDLAAALCTRVFCTSKYSYTAKYAKTRLMPVGVDTERFFLDTRVARAPRSILFLSRIAPSKRVDMFIDALGHLAKQGTDFTATIVGSPLPQGEAYYASLKQKVIDARLAEHVSFKPAVAHYAAPDIYRAHEIFVNTSPSGMLDKTIFEAAACGCVPLTSSQDTAEAADVHCLFAQGDSIDLAAKLRILLALDPVMREGLAERARARTTTHSLSCLAVELSRALLPCDLVLFQNGSIGDFLMFSHLATQIMSCGKFSHVTIVVPRNAPFLSALVGAYPYISVREISSRAFRGAFSLWRGPKTVIVHPTTGHIPLRVKLLVWFITRKKGSQSIGFQDKGLLCWLYTKTLAYDTERSYVETIQMLARAAGATPSDDPPRLFFTPTPGALSHYRLFDRRYVVFHPGASNPRRRFSISDARDVVEFIRTHLPDVVVVFSGGADEVEYIRAIASTDHVEHVRFILGAPAGELMTVLAGAELYIGTDTGITHLACFLGTRVVEVAHNATKNWLAFYAPQATVLYLLQGEHVTHTGATYIQRSASTGPTLFDRVPTPAIVEALRYTLSHAS